MNAESCSHNGFMLNHRGGLKKTRDVTIKGPKACNDHDYKTISAVRAQLQNTMECADVVCHLQNHLCLFMCVYVWRERGRALHFGGNFHHI